MRLASSSSPLKTSQVVRILCIFLAQQLQGDNPPRLLRRAPFQNHAHAAAAQFSGQGEALRHDEPGPYQTLVIAHTAPLSGSNNAMLPSGA